MRRVPALLPVLSATMIGCAGALPRPQPFSETHTAELEARSAGLRVPREGPITLLVIGDTGKGTRAQARVAAAAKAQCALEGCDLGAMVGDNIYDRGIERPDSPLFAARMGIYDELGFPVVVVLGNHDYGSPFAMPPFGGIGLEEVRAEAQIEAVSRTRNMHLPGRHWRLDLGRVELVGLDTQAAFWLDAPALAEALRMEDDVLRQEKNLRKWNLSATAPMRIALGHHPYRSAGPHGDAGTADHVPRGLVFSNEHIRLLLEEHVLGHFDLYLAGHDHNLQDAGEAEGTTLLVSGGGAEKKPLDEDPSRIPFGAEAIGFMILDVEPEERRVRIRIYGVGDGEDDVTAKLLHERVVDRGAW